MRTDRFWNAAWVSLVASQVHAVAGNVGYSLAWIGVTLVGFAIDGFINRSQL